MADNTYWRGDQRFAPAPVVEMPDYMAEDPVLAEEWRRTHPEGDVQVADSDELNTTRLALLLAGTVGGGALAEWLAAGGMAAGGAGTLTPAAAEAAAAAPEAAGAAGLGAVTGLPGGVLAGGTALPGAAALPAAAAAAPTLGAATTGITAAQAAALPGGATMGAVPTAASAGGGGTMSTIGRLANTGLRAAAAGTGAASNAEAANRGIANDYELARARLQLENNDLGLRGYQANTQAKSAMESALINRAQLEAGQRATDLKNLYRSSVAKNPTFSQFNDRPLTFSPEFLGALENVGKQASTSLATGPKYRAADLPALTYEPYKQPDFTPPTMQQPGTMSKVGNWLGPVLAGASAYFGGR